MIVASESNTHGTIYTSTAPHEMGFEFSPQLLYANGELESKKRLSIP